MDSSRYGQRREILTRFCDLYADVDGLRLRYWDVGDGSPVLLLHGLGCSVEWWFPNVDVLATHHRVLALDLPGFGRSDKKWRGTRTFGPRFDADLVTVFLRQLGATPAALIGNSFGGLVALFTALNHPETVERLVLVDSAGLGREIAPSLRLLSLPFLGEVALAMLSPKRWQAAAIKGAVSYPQVQPPEFGQRHAELLALPGTKAAFLRALRTEANLSGQLRPNLLLEQLPRITAPTMIFWGKNDPLLPVSHAYAAQKALPGAQLHVFDSCRHCPQLERPDQFNAMVLAFLAGRRSE